MEQRIQLLTLGVTDLDEARRFYVDGLGWEETLHVPGEVVFIQLGHGLLLGLYTGLAGDAGVELGGGTPRMSMARNVGSEGEVRDLVARAEAAGATVVKPPQRAAFGGYHAYFTDPAGFLWEVARNPGLTFDASGRASFG